MTQLTTEQVALIEKWLRTATKEELVDILMKHVATPNEKTEDSIRLAAETTIRITSLARSKHQAYIDQLVAKLGY